MYLERMRGYMNKEELLDVIEFARYQTIEGFVENDYPHEGGVEALARMTEVLRQSGRELASSIGRRVVMNDGQEGVITGHCRGDVDTYNVFINGEEVRVLNYEGITEKHFKWLEDSDAD